MKKVVWILGVLVIVIAIIGGGYGYIKVNNLQVVTRQAVCSSVIDSYNTALKATDDYKTQIGNIAEEIKKKPHYNDDLNCIVMLFNDAYTHQDNKKMQEYYDRAKELDSQGKYVSLKIESIADLRQMKDMVSAKWEAQSDDASGSAEN